MTPDFLIRGPARRTRLVGWLVLLSIAGFSVPPLLAQSPDSELAPDYVAPAVVEAPAIPDLSDATLAAQQVDNRHLTMHFGLAVLADYTAFNQDAASEAQVGHQENQAEFRSFRFILRGDLKFLGHWQYFIAAEYKGFGQNDGADDWAFGDVTLSHALWSPLAKSSSFSFFVHGFAEEGNEDENDGRGRGRFSGPGGARPLLLFPFGPIPSRYALG